MKFKLGETPKWKRKPKVSPLDSDTEFLKLCNVISSNTLRPGGSAWIYLNQNADSLRLKTKHPARLVRDRVRRFLRELQLEADYRLVARETADPGIWAVGVILEPREAALSTAAASRRKA